MAGLFAAILLERQGADVMIYEKSGADLSGRGAGLTGGPELFEAIRRIGCTQVSRPSVVSERQVVLDHDGSIMSDQVSAGARFCWDTLYKAARSKLRQEQYLQSRPVMRVEAFAERATIVFEGGDREDADLVIGADGIGSVTRKEVEPDRF